MNIDIDLTMKKEARFQGELYCVLRRFISEIGAFPELVPSDVYIEPSIPQLAQSEEEQEKARKRADIVLIAKEFSTGSQKPVLVIECKQRKIPVSNLRKHYGDALEQAEEYARLIDCKMYATYDGHTFILMQLKDPYLIGISQWPVHKLGKFFAKQLWHFLLEPQKEIRVQYYESFIKNPDLEPWIPVIPGLIQDAMMRESKVSGFDYPVEEAKANSQERANRYLSLIR